MSNTYAKVANVESSTLGTFGFYWSGVLAGNLPDGPMLLTGNDGVYGYLPFTNGVSLEGSFIEPSVLAEPGVVAPGQTIFVLATLTSPANTPYLISAETGSPVFYDIEVGSNVTVSLVSQSGKTVATEPIYSNSFVATTQGISGRLTVPAGTPPGLYDVILSSSYYSFSLGTAVDGAYFGQVYVAQSASIPRISISPSVQFEGQTIGVSARIDYPNGSSVKYGMYSAAVYPKDLQNSYTSLTATIQVPMWFDSATGLWSGNITLPSAYNSGGSVAIDPGTLYLSGPYEVFISGLSADGVPSSTDISTQQGISVQPYLYLSGQDLSSLPQTSQVAFSNDQITGSMSLSGDLFLGKNTIQGGTYTDLFLADQRHTVRQQRPGDPHRGFRRVRRRTEQQAPPPTVQSWLAAADRLDRLAERVKPPTGHSIHPGNIGPVPSTEPELRRDLREPHRNRPAGVLSLRLPGRREPRRR